MSEPTAEPARPKTSEAKIRSNRLNSMKSTGPRTEAGKNNSKYNNLTHGMCTRTPVVLPDECPEQAARDAADVVRDLGAVGPTEVRLALEYAGTLQTIARCRTAEGGALSLAINAARDQAADGQQAEVARLGGHLVDGTDLDETIAQLRSTSAGCSYLLEQWNLISDYLNVFQCLEPVQFALALHLCGRRPCDWFRDGVVRDWTHAYVCASSGDRVLDAEAVCDLLQFDRPAAMSPDEYLHHAQSLIDTPIGAEAAHARLRALVAAQIKELTERVELLRLREARDLEDRIALARVDGSPEGRNRRLYEAAAIRNLKALRVEIEHLQALRRERGDAPEAPEAAEDVVGGTEANAAKASEEPGGSPGPVPPARPAVLATLGVLALGAWQVVRHWLE